jgi:hypothetical protein
MMTRARPRRSLQRTGRGVKDLVRSAGSGRPLRPGFRPGGGEQGNRRGHGVRHRKKTIRFNTGFVDTETRIYLIQLISNYVRINE